MRKLSASTAVATLVLSAGAALVATPAEAAGTVHGCQSGYVCVYPQNKGWNGDHPTPGMTYYTYGYHNIHGQYGTHRIFNNQTGGAAAWTCYGADGTGGSYLLLGAGGWSDENLTPINSIYLTKSVGPLGYDPC